MCTIWNIQFKLFYSMQILKAIKFVLPISFRKLSKVVTYACRDEMNNIASHIHKPNVEQVVGIGAHTCENINKATIFIMKEVCCLVWLPQA